MKFPRRLFAASAVMIILACVMFLPHAMASGTPFETSADDQKEIAITIYNDGTGLVKDTRNLNMPTGQVDMVFMDVAASIDATSVHFVSNTAPNAIGILEQNYEYDLVSTAKLYEKYLDKQISIRTSDGRTITGTLLSSSGGMVIQTAEGIVIVNDVTEVTFEKLPEGLITRPTLKWSLINDHAGSQECEMSYLTSGMTWSANYVAVVNQNDSKLDLSGWVTINNTSGTGYNDAVLKLVAGQIHRVTPQYNLGYDEYAYDGRAAGMAAEGGFEEESFFEYHLYTLQRPATVLNNQQKQISLLEGEGIGANKIFVFDPAAAYYGIGDTTEGKIEVNLKFMNSERNGLGLPLPKGIIRVYKEDSSGSLQFIGEDRIDHTPKDEEIEIYLGEAFDIVGERVVMDRRELAWNLWEYDVEVTLRNHKTEKVDVIYWDHVWGDWTVTKSNYEYSQKDASTVEFVLPVAVDGETKLTYTIRRQW